MPKIITNNLVGVKESVLDELLLLNQHQIPLLSELGFSNAITSIMHEWFEDELFADESTITTDMDAAGTTVKVASAEPFAVGFVIKVGEELLKVTAINGTDLTVVRGYAGTTPATAVNGAKVEVMFDEAAEGHDAREARFKPRTHQFNYTQIFSKSVKISGSAAAVAQHNIDNLYEYEKQKKQVEMALEMEKALINGVKYQSADGLVRTGDGIRNRIKTNVTDAAGQSVTDEMINDTLQSIYEKGGFSEAGDYRIIVPAKQKRAISAFAKDKLRLTQGETRNGRVVDMLVTDFGEFPVQLNNNLNANELFVTDYNRLSVHPLVGREPQHEYLGKRGDYYEGMIVSELTSVLRQEKAHGRIKNLG